jgi:hypothetical protein
MENNINNIFKHVKSFDTYEEAKKTGLYDTIFDSL